jgi:hypothetical protein
MVRNVMMVRLRPGYDAARLAGIQAGFRGLDGPGTLSYTIGDDRADRPRPVRSAGLGP